MLEEVPVHDFSAARNGDFRKSITISVAGSPLDLTGWSAKLQVRAAPGASGDPLISIETGVVGSNGSTITVTDALAGALELFIDDADIAALPDTAAKPARATFYYDLLLTESGGDVGPYLRGKFIVDEGVTR